MTPLDKFLDRVESRSAVVGVVGLGYVGLPVALTFAEAGFNVIGIDFSEEKVASITNGTSYLTDIPSERLQAVTSAGRFRAASSYADLRDADAILICVPTPLRQGAPDLSMVTASGEGVAEVLKDCALVVLESTTYPGTTEELLRPLLEGETKVAGHDFFLAYSPERIDPGNDVYSFADIPKVVGGIDEGSTRAAQALYQQVVPKVVTVSSTREAELSKLIENTFRHVNIALVNELAIYAHELGIDIWESIEAAATKPFGFLPFWPGPGWGGHCIPLDPAYLSWRVRQDRAHEVRFVELAHAVNSEMPRHVVERISLILNEQEKSVSNARILAIGVAYKGGTKDTRESPALKVLASLERRGAVVSFHDPLVESIKVEGNELTSTPLTEEALASHDLVVVLARQEQVDWDLLRRKARLIFDCCNAFGGPSDNIVRL